MIQFEKFTLATPPCSGSTLFLQACSCARLTYTQDPRGRYAAPPDGFEGFVVAISKHPWNWLCELFLLATNFEIKKIGLLDFDVLLDDIKSAEGNINTFLEFYIECRQGHLTKLYRRYNPSNIIKYDDFPYAIQEFFESIGVGLTNVKLAELHQFKQKQTIHKDVNRSLKMRLMDAESDFCEAYDYC